MGVKIRSSTGTIKSVGMVNGDLRMFNFRFGSVLRLMGLFGESSDTAITSLGAIRVNKTCTNFPDLLDPFFISAVSPSFNSSQISAAW